GKLRKALSTKTPSAISRTTNEFGEFNWPTVNELQSHLDNLETGSEVTKDLGKIFTIHGQSMVTAMTMRRFVDRAQADFQVDFNVPGAGKVTGDAMMTKQKWNALPQAVKDQYR